MKGRLWLVYTILAAFSWGMWGVLTKFISIDVTPFETHLMFTTGALFTLPIVIRKCRISEMNLKGLAFGIGASLLVLLGNISVYQSFKIGGGAAVVIPFTNLYPLVTILIAFFIFKERLNRLNWAGILVIIPAIIFLSGQSKILSEPEHFFQTFELKAWLLFAFLSLLLFGLFSAAQKVVTNYLSTGWSYLSFVVSSALISVFFIVFGLVDFNFSYKTFLFGSSAGFLDGLGVLAIYSAYRARGKASKVSSIGSTMQQVFTIILALVFLHERIDLTIFMGISLAIIGSYLLLWEKKFTKSEEGTSIENSSSQYKNHE